MAAVSAPQAQSLLNPMNPRPDAGTWNISVPAQSVQSELLQTQDLDPELSKPYNHELTKKNTEPNVSQQYTNTHDSMRSTDNALLPHLRSNVSKTKEHRASDTGSTNDSLLELYGSHRSGMNSLDLGYRTTTNSISHIDDEDRENSRWIHRDKLARIENQELQAAGIFIPRSRAPSKASNRQEHSKDLQLNNLRIDQNLQRPRIDSLPTDEEEAIEKNTWDLRLPEEAAADYYYADASGGVKGISRIPVCKKSPLPIPMAQLERDRLLSRIKSNNLSGEEDSTLYPKSHENDDNLKDSANNTPTSNRRSVSENVNGKKPSAQSRSASVNRVNNQRPRTRSGSVALSTSLRSGENGQAASRHPEGDPPWLSSMYKPDPRLPPDQQLLPTIAKRLQQEQWEKEGKFGTVYDTSFRPLNNQPFGTPPVTLETTNAETNANIPANENKEEWPLQIPKSPTMSTGRPGTAAGYSTMPKIIETPPIAHSQPDPSPTPKLSESPEEKKKKGCGCCVIM